MVGEPTWQSERHPVYDRMRFRSESQGEVSMMAKQSGEPRKVRWTVPAVDTSVIEWLDEQENISQSLRLLIRESIQRDGYIDVVYKPVDQLPRRGRPPLESTEQRDDEPSPVRAPQHEESAVDRRPGVRSVQPRPAVTDNSDVDSDSDVEKAAPEPEAQRETAKPEPASAPAEKAEEPEASAAPQPPKQASIDEIMASTRR
ncbi:hypothetical protein ACFWNT_29700 [Streptomyces sp. NPDC058409]|uniref:hypothetical protein n=1 Tax=Streptomyces sp. NPDC058409 TaxID=3346484 RepID=UPI00364799D0